MLQTSRSSGKTLLDNVIYGKLQQNLSFRWQSKSKVLRILKSIELYIHNEKLNTIDRSIISTIKRKGEGRKAEQ